MGWQRAVSYGVDTPEMQRQVSRGKGRIAILAKRVRQNHCVSDHVILHNIKLGKFAGRVLASSPARNSAKTLAEHTAIEEGHARPYDGGARSGWCEE